MRYPSICRSGNILAVSATLVLSLLSAGCVRVKLAPEAQAVRVTTNADAVKGCKPLGLVKGSDRLQGGLIGQGAAEDNATTRLRNATAKLGGNVVMLMASKAGYSGASAQGEAYACPAGG